MSKTTKTILIVAGAMLALGLVIMLVVMISVGFNFDGLGINEKYTLVEKQIELSEVKYIDVESNVEDIIIGTSEDEYVHVSYYDSEKKVHLYEVKDGVLSVKCDYKWYQMIHIGFGSKDRNIEILLPSGFDGDISLTGATGGVSVRNLSGFSRLDVTVSTGNVTLADLKVGSAEVTCSTGTIELTNFTSDSKLEITCGMGDVDIIAVNAEALTVTTTTGSIDVNATKAARIELTCTTGGIRFNDLESEDLRFTATTGDIHGKLKHSMMDYTINSKTATGDSSLPTVSYGKSYYLSAQTSTGDINITFEQ